MNIEMKEKMDGLVDLSAERSLRDAAREILADFQKEGFEKEDVAEYIAGIIAEEFI